MAVNMATYDDDNMVSGKFYFLEVNKDNATNLREVTSITGAINENTIKLDALEHKIGEVPNIYFNDLRYLEVISDNDRAFDIWEVLHEGDYDYASLITHGVEIYKRTQDGQTKIILKTDRPVARGYLQFY